MKIKKEKGQASIEFIIALIPLIFFVFLVFNVGMAWHGYHVTENIALNGGSAEAKMPGGFGGTTSKGIQWLPSQWSMFASAQYYDDGTTLMRGDTVTMIKVEGSGNALVPLPWGIDIHPNFKGSVVVPNLTDFIP